jgi:hypothetical protein
VDGRQFSGTAGDKKIILRILLRIVLCVQDKSVIFLAYLP